MCRASRHPIISQPMTQPTHKQKSNEQQQQVLYSPALYHGQINVTERTDISRGRLFSGTRLKARIFPLLHRLIRYTPVPVALLPVRFVAAFALLLYLWPGNRLRSACDSIGRLAAGAGRPVNTWSVYKAFLRNAVGAIENFFMLYRHGADSVLPRLLMQQHDIDDIHRLIREHGGIILAVPHNLGSAFSALLVGHTFDMLLVAKNSPTIERTRIAIDFYERMTLKLLMVRDGNIFELSRTLYSVLKQGKLVAATLDNIDRSENREVVSLFGQQVGLSVWAAKIAARLQVPIVPAYFSSEGNRIRIHVGRSIVTDDIHGSIQHYAEFFEAEILRDPGSWAYLADKHWQALLEQAARQSSERTRP